MRAVLDVNVIISAFLAPDGAPASLLRAWSAGTFELLVSPRLLAELERALAYPKLRKGVTAAEAQRVAAWLAASATTCLDPTGIPIARSPDPGDDYLIALASDERAALVSGDRHLLGLAEVLPIYSPAEFLRLIEGQDI